MSEARTRDPIPEFNTLKEIAEFWDTHSTAEYFDVGEEVHFEVRTRKRQMRIALLPELREQIEAQAHARGVTSETLVNWWIAERLQQAA